ncbi:metallo-beta-lactamase domain protein [Gleimia coleocanis DSM 15436]|uniref:Metallo-beta-lactamase domain protein n=1 Tax=Gleimia coleocanis DSM 15436 TaxID=525245 RepID=C0W0T0_9ACTO|nr:MBL fold metallo-hydrolase [Gleimia coleocanis]EEH63654.1 metallo-beta-lactamase domain protein [Gleimia coleocanis DSM 15436]
MKLTVVGCTGSMSGPYSPASCYLVQGRGIDPETGLDRVYNVVFDLGPGSFGQLWRYVDPRKIDAVIFSHLHADHMGDVISLHVHRRWHPQGNLGQVTLGGPSNLLDRVRGIDGADESEDYAAEFAPLILEDGVSFNVGPLKITPYAAWHTVESYGFRVEGPSEGDAAKCVTIAYTGDTDYCERMVEMAEGVELLLSEAGFTAADEVRGIHLTGERAAQLAKTAQAKSMVLTHIQAWTDSEVVLREARLAWDGAISVAYAGATYTV